jgi:hypothetical protein
MRHPRFPQLSKIVLLLIAACGLATQARADTPASLFDPARHMRIAEVHPGMTGYGLSVFKGSKIERFDVEVVSVLKNFNPKYDVILIRCHGHDLEHTGAVAGMSGSPIFLKDDSGRERMVGAFAYGFPMAKDPIAGVQPIEYMLRLNPNPPTTQESITGGASSDHTVRASAGQSDRKIRWSLRDAVLLPGMNSPPRNFPLLRRDRLSPNPMLGGSVNESSRLEPLVTPLMTSGLSTKLVEEYSPLFRAYGFHLLQAGGGIGGSAPIEEQPAKIEPGSTLVSPMLTGDVELVATGTCTEVLGDHVFAFGHSFNGEGPVNLPFGSGQVNGIIATLTSSFKLGSMTAMRGALLDDQTVGVAGRLGAAPALVPMELTIDYADKSQEPLVYKFNMMRHPKLTPLIASMAVSSAITGARELPQYHTLDYDIDVAFDNGKHVAVRNTLVNVSSAELFMEIATPMLAAAENPFERVFASRITGTVHVTPEARSAKILSINVPKLKYRPGETLKAYVSYRPFRGEESILPIELELPKDLSDDTYQLVISDAERYLQDEQQAKPFRFDAETIDEVFGVLKDLEEVRHNAVYARLVRQPDGVAVGRTAMPHLPSSMRTILLGSGRSDTTPFVSSTVKSIPTQLVMEGSAEFEITIDSEFHVESGSGVKPAKPDQQSPLSPQKIEDAKPKTGKTDAEQVTR